MIMAELQMKSAGKKTNTMLSAMILLFPWIYESNIRYISFYTLKSFRSHISKSQVIQVKMNLSFSLLKYTSRK